MAGRALILVSTTLVIALSVLVVVGTRIFERDRSALFANYGHQRQLGAEEVARGVQTEISDIAEDLDLASTLLQGVSSRQISERELHAIATIKREYLAMYASTDDAEITKVSAFDAPPEILPLADATLQELLARAAQHPGQLHVSTAFVSSGRASWYRVFARRPKDHGPTVATVIDMSVLLGRMKLPSDPAVRAVVVDANGETAPVGDARLASLIGRGHLATVVAAARTGASTHVVVEGELARVVGLPDAKAVAVGVPIAIDAGPPWTLLVVASAQALQTQEKTIVRRVLVGSALVLLLLCSAAAYVLHNTFRARSLRERLRHTEQLAHSERLVTAGQLAAGIAHEIGTPLNVARGRVELSLSHLGPDHAEAANQRVVIDQIDRVTRQIQQLLDYVRPAPTTLQEVDLSRTLRVVRDLLAPQAAKRHVALEVEASEEPPLVHADPDQVQQIIVNLTLNAIDACDRGGTVHLRGQRRDNVISLEVADDGQGIAPGLQKQVFDPFFTTKKRGQGTGLGLWVVAQLVRAQSAQIELASRPGQGTRVTVTWTGA
jgi:signal transduction histidine kinase